MIWLWLDDEQESILIYDYYLKKEGILYNKFNNTTELQEFILKRRVNGNLNRYGLIIDILLLGEEEISVSEKWLGTSNKIYRKSEMGIYAGIDFVESFVLSKSVEGRYIWDPLPPIIFLTKMYYFKDLKNKIENKLKKLENIYEFSGRKEFFAVHNKLNDISILLKTIKKMERLIEK